VARPQRQGAGGTSAGGHRVAVRDRTLDVPAPANDNRLGLKRQVLRLLPVIAAIGLVLSLIRHLLG
jgi:hypothetical protein